MIPFVNLSAQYKAYKDEIDSAIISVLESGSLIGGAEVQKFEENLAMDTGAPYAVSCASGTSALCLALAALGLTPGDEVIVPDFTFAATADAVALLGGIPRFADIGDDFLISPLSVEERISPKTVGIIAVDLFGQCANYAELKSIASKHGLWILEDAAQSIGALQNGKGAGSLATIAATSFYPTKPFGAYGDAGAVLTADEHLASQVRKFASHGRNAEDRYATVGTNSRLDAIQAAILNVKRNHLEKEILARQQNAELYNKLFSHFPKFKTPSIAKGNSSIFAQYAVTSKDRENVIQKFSEVGVPTRIYYNSPLSAEPCFAHLKTAASDAHANFNAYRLSKEVFCMPIDAFTDVLEISRKIKSVL
ncbi:MAG: DegT/DnrJ/EryC1/StrS family aminotransferase [Fibrobacter sp.]|nr:DegT/DnrJ/EryC1/StrS family aminotransferase [Fibrobacter sp.]